MTMTESSPLAQPDIVSNPYPVYTGLQDTDPVHWCDSLNAWAIMRYADCADALKDSRLKAERMEEVLGAKFPGQPLAADNIYHRFTKSTMMYTDDPQHAALRRGAQSAFTPAAHEHYSDVIRQTAADLVATIPAGTTQIDGVADLALKLPVLAAVSAFGVPEEDLDFIVPRVDTIMTYWSGPQEQPVPLDQLLTHLTDLHTYAAELLQGKRGKVLPDTCIARLAGSHAERHDWTDEQALHQLVLLLIALFAPTTPGSVSSGMMSFATNPAQVERYRSDPRYLDNTADEVFRYNASNQFTWRSAGTTLELCGKTIEKGQNVALFLGAANRDPRRFDRPDEFDITRHDSGKHLSFGTGPHVCLGKQIAKLEVKWFFAALLERFGTVSLAGDPIWNSNLEFRSLKFLPLSVG